MSRIKTNILYFLFYSSPILLLLLLNLLLLLVKRTGCQASLPRLAAGRSVGTSQVAGVDQYRVRESPHIRHRERRGDFPERRRRPGTN